MQIKTKAEIGGQVFDLEYNDAESFDDLPRNFVEQVYGVCFYQTKLVIGHNRAGHWSLLGGTIEPKENYLQTLRREIKEESNMKLVRSIPIGYQVSYLPQQDPIYQLRYACIVEPYGVFAKDPDDSVDKIKLINPKNYKEYFNWGKISDRLIDRAIKLLARPS